MQKTRRAGLVLTLLFVASLPAITPRIYASDEIEYFSFLRSLWFDRDLSFDNEYRHFFDRGLARSQGFHETFLERTTPTGRRENFATIGCALLWAPFYATADLGVRARAALGYAARADGYSPPYIAAACYASALYGFLALLLSLHAFQVIARADLARAAGPAATLAVWLGTPLLFYMYIAPPYSHAVSAFAVAAFVVAWLHVRRRWSPGGFALLGALAALMAMVREQDIFIAGGPALDLALTGVAAFRRSRAEKGGAPSRPGPGRLAIGALVSGAAFVVCYLPQAAAYLVLNGRVGPSRLVARKMTWTSPHALQVLASPDHGFLFWTPLALLSIAGLILLALGRRRGTTPGTQPPVEDGRRVGACLLLMVALQVYVAGSIESWTVAGAFGQRRFVGLTIALVVGLGVLLSRARSPWRRAAVTLALVLTVWWNVALLVQFGSGMMDRQRLELAPNAYNAFVVVPRDLPGVAYRYLFERDSFYRWGRPGGEEQKKGSGARIQDSDRHEPSAETSRAVEIRPLAPGS